MSFLKQNISIGVVGKNEKFHILNDEENARYVAAVEKRSGPPPDDGGPGGAMIEDIADPSSERGPGEPQVQVAMET